MWIYLGQRTKTLKNQEKRYFHDTTQHRLGLKCREEANWGRKGKLTNKRSQLTCFSALLNLLLLESPDTSKCHPHPAAVKKPWIITSLSERERMRRGGERNQNQSLLRYLRTASKEINTSCKHLESIWWWQPFSSVLLTKQSGHVS